MLNYLKTLSLFTLTTILFAACTQSPCGVNKNYFLQNFETFVNDIQEQDLPYNDESWVDHDKKFNHFKDECFEQFKDKMTESEKEEFFGDAAKYVWLRYGSGFVNQILDKDGEVLDNFLDDISDAWDGTENDITTAIDDLRKEVENIDKEKLEDLMKEIGGDIEEWGNKIEEIFKDVEIEINEN
ncbi:MAG: hypothetical protein AAF502_00825 [Bacteroidota bacterium]